MLGALIGLIIIVPAAKAGWFQPKVEERFDFEARSKWEPEWIGQLQDAAEKEIAGQKMNLIKAWLPYVIVAALLVLTRVWDTLNGWLTHDVLTISWSNIFGSSVSTSSQPFYLPGFLFLVTSLITYMIHNMRSRQGAYARAWNDS